jgi:hypothetical protein
VVEMSSRDASIEQDRRAASLSSCEIGDIGELPQFRGSFQGGMSQSVELPKLQITGHSLEDVTSNATCLKSNDEIIKSKEHASESKDAAIESKEKSTESNPLDPGAKDKTVSPEEKPDPGSAEAVAQAAEDSEHAQYWKKNRISRDKTQNGLFGCAIQASEVMVKAGAISNTVFGVGQLIEEAKDNGWTEVKAGQPIEPGDLVIAYHPENPKAEGQRHAAIAAEPNEKGEPMVWNNTNRTRLPDEDDRSKQWDKEPLSNLPYPAYKVYRAPDQD